MLPSELIVKVLDDESNRVFSWANGHTSPAIAGPAVAGAFSSLWRRAITSWRTPDGPLAFLLSATEAGIRRRPARGGSYLPRSARLTCAVPTLDELGRAAHAYAWIGMAAADSKLEFTQASMVVSTINAHGVLDAVVRSVQLHGYEAARGRDVFLRLLDVADHLVAGDGEPAAAARHVAKREFERSRRWLMKVPSGG